MKLKDWQTNCKSVKKVLEHTLYQTYISGYRSLPDTENNQPESNGVSEELETGVRFYSTRHPSTSL